MNTSVIAVAHRVNDSLHGTMNLLGSLLMTKLMGAAFSPQPNLLPKEKGLTSSLSGRGPR